MTAAVKLPFFAGAKHRAGRVLSYLKFSSYQGTITSLLIPDNSPKFSAYFAIPKFFLHRLI